MKKDKKKGSNIIPFKKDAKVIQMSPYDPDGLVMRV